MRSMASNISPCCPDGAGAYPLLQGQTSDKSGNERNVSRLLVFKLGANG